jgi:hypothetical protein
VSPSPDDVATSMLAQYSDKLRQLLTPRPKARPAATQR